MDDKAWGRDLEESRVPNYDEELEDCDEKSGTIRLPVEKACVDCSLESDWVNRNRMRSHSDPDQGGARRQGEELAHSRGGSEKSLVALDREREEPERLPALLVGVGQGRAALQRGA